MPEGPSIILLKEDAKKFTNKKVLEVYGNAKVDKDLLKGKTVLEFKTWGKHFLITFKTVSVRIHLLMFGNYSINEKNPGRAIRLGLRFTNGELNFYTCSVKLLEEKLDLIYDWTADVMNPAWNSSKAKLKLKKIPKTMVCDALLEQDIFAGVGNIIKNEVLYRIRVHPESEVGKLPAAKLNAMVKEASAYSFQFLKWKRASELKKHWLVYSKAMCDRCNLPIARIYTGKKKRSSSVCTNCQKLYK